MRLLDLFCCAGGAAVGYHRAGFTEVVGVDITHQKSYPFEFVLGDALEYVLEHGHEFDAIHASPPCQEFCNLSAPWKRNGRTYSNLIPATRAALIILGKPYIIENVVGAKSFFIDPVTLCGSMFPELRVYRHRLFETSFPCHVPMHYPHKDKTPRVAQEKLVARDLLQYVEIADPSTTAKRQWV